MNDAQEVEALWNACVTEPEEDTVRGALADRLAEAGYTALGDAIRGAAGRVFVAAVAGRPRANAVLRLQFTAAEQRDEELEQLVRDQADEILGDEAVNDLMNDTNAGNWSLSDLELGEPEFTPDRCRVQVGFTVCGEPDPDQVFVGDTIRGTAELVVPADGPVTCTVLDAEIEDYADPFGDTDE